jgi:hypothetical protein
MAVAIVQAFEVIDIDDNDGERACSGQRSLPQLGILRIEGAAVGQPGQGIAL